MSISQNFPAISPTLNLNFARSKKLDPRITFTRTSSATRTNAQGLIEVVSTDTPRFEHSYNSSTGSVNSLGLLIEESRTNLALRSNTFNTYWTSVSATCVFTQNVTGPDGVANGAWTIDDQYTGGDGAGFEQSVSITPSTSTNYCLSIFAKQGTATYFDFYAFFVGTSTKGSYFRYNFSTDTISVSSADGGGISPTIYGKVAYPNGWYRFYFVVNDANSGLNNLLAYRIYPASRDAGVTGTTLFYGAQFEIGAFPTSYIPTVASTVTRSADNASMTGTNFTSWYNQTEGSVYCRYNRIGIQSASTTVPTPWGVSDGTFSNSMTLIGGYSVPGNRRFDILNSGSATAQLDFTGTETAQTFNKVCVTYKLNDIAGSYNAQTVLTDTSSNIPSVNQLCIGRRDPATLVDYLNGNISQLLYYPRRLTNTQLQNLTK